MCLSRVKRQAMYEREIYINNTPPASLKKKVTTFLNRKGTNSLNKKGTNSLNRKGATFLNRKGSTSLNRKVYPLFNNEENPESLLTFGAHLLTL